MKTLNLNEYGVAELNANEMRQTDGGFSFTSIHVLLEIFGCHRLGDGMLPPVNFEEEISANVDAMMAGLDMDGYVSPGVNNWNNVSQ